MELNIGMGVEPEIVKSFEGKWVHMRIEGRHKYDIALLKKAGERSGLFVTPTQRKEFAVLYEDIMSISVHSGTLNLPDGKVRVLNGVIVDVATKILNGV